MTPTAMRHALLVFLSTLCAAGASAANLYVAPTGSDAGTCTQAAPCRQIRRALQLVNPAETILVADGSYLGFDVRNRNGTPGNPITIRAQGVGAVVTPTTDRPDNRDTIFVTFSSYVVIDGLRAFGANRAAVRVDEGAWVTVKNGVFGNNGTWGIFTDFTDDLLLENNECYGSVAEHGIYVSNSGDRPVLRGNRAHDNNASGIQLNADASVGGDGIITGALIENNVLYSNGTLGGAAINLDGVQDSTVRNNVLYDNHATGIVNYRGDGAEGPRLMRILHNTIDQASNGRWALLIHDTTGMNTVRNNVLYNRHSFRGAINYGGPADVANTDSDYNVLDRVTPDDNAVLTLAQWQAQGHEPHSFSATLAALFVNANGANYHLAPGSPAINTGQTLASVAVDIEGTARPQGSASDIGAYESPAAAVPSLSVNDVMTAEGNTGTTNAVFTVTLSSAASQTVTVSFATSNGTAVAPADYTTASGALTFNVGVTTQTFNVAVVGDTVVEPNEAFTVTLGGASGATISDALGVGTIVDDDLPTLSVNDVTLTEGNTGSQNALFTVSLSQAVTQTVTVNYGVAGGTATAGEDFGTAGGTLILTPGATTALAEVPVFGDWTFEANETFTLNLSAPTGATVADGTGAGTITDDDVAGLTINDAVVRERVGTTATVTFTVTLSPASTGLVTVNYATADGTATAVNDYVLASGPLVFAPGETTKPVTVIVNPDALVEGVETFSVNLSGESGAAIAHGTGTGQILDPPLGSDFNADGNTDLAWRHDVSGQNVIWHMDGTTLLGGTFTTPPALADTGWRIVGTNDFNADGRPDLLWRHRISGQNVLWYMNGAVMQSGTFLTPAALADVNWDMSGTGDFNLDGKPDILWRHAVSGQIVVWYMGGADGSVLQSGEFLTPSAFTDVNWQTVGTGDFNLDGHTDILWRHAVAGQNVVWFMKGSKLMNGAFTNPPALVDVNWRMVATGDYNDDGKVDIVWRHSVSGQNVIWFMDGLALTGGDFTSTLADNNWRIVGPR